MLSWHSAFAVYLRGEHGFTSAWEALGPSRGRSTSLKGNDHDEDGYNHGHPTAFLIFTRASCKIRMDMSLELQRSCCSVVPYTVIRRLSYTKLTSSSLIGCLLHEALGHLSTCRRVFSGPEFFGHLIQCRPFNVSVCIDPFDKAFLNPICERGIGEIGRCLPASKARVDGCQIHVSVIFRVFSFIGSLILPAHVRVNGNREDKVFFLPVFR